MKSVVNVTIPVFPSRWKYIARGSNINASDEYLFVSRRRAAFSGWMDRIGTNSAEQANVKQQLTGYHGFFLLAQIGTILVRIR